MLPLKCGVGNRGTRDSTGLPRVNSTFLTTSHYAEDFKQGAKLEKAADTRVVDGTLLKIPLC